MSNANNVINFPADRVKPSQGHSEGEVLTLDGLPSIGDEERSKVAAEAVSLIQSGYGSADSLDAAIRAYAGTMGTDADSTNKIVRSLYGDRTLEIFEDLIFDSLDDLDLDSL
jgi:hypothetical protein